MATFGWALALSAAADELPDGAIARLGQQRSRITTMPKCIAWSPTGDLLAIGDTAGGIHIYDPEKHEQVRTLRGHSTEVADVAFSPDGSRLASVSKDQTVRFWDPATGKLLHTEKVGVRDMMRVMYTPDGKRVAATGRDHVLMWNAEDYKRVCRAKTHKGRVWAAGLSPDGKLLATGGDDRTIHIWNTENGKLVRKLPKKDRVYWSIAWSADGKTLYAGTSGSGQVDALDPETGKEKPSFGAVGGIAAHLGATPDRKHFITRSTDSHVRVWDAKTQKVVTDINIVPRNGNYNYIMNGVAVSPDSKRLAITRTDRIIEIRDLASGELIDSGDGHLTSVMDMVFSPDGKLLASTAADMTVRLWDMKTMSQKHRLDVSNSYAAAMCFPDDRTLRAITRYSASTDLYAWDITNGKERARHALGERYVRSAAFSGDGSRVALSSSTNTMTVWDTTSAKRVASLGGYRSRPTAIVYSRRNRLIAALENNELKIYRNEGGFRQTHELKLGTSARGLALSPDGRTAAVLQHNRELTLWDTSSGLKVKEIKISSSVVHSFVMFHPTLRHVLLVAGGSDEVEFWDMVNGRSIGKLKAGHTPTSIAIGPAGERLATSSDDTTITVWNTPKLKDAHIVIRNPSQRDLLSMWNDLSNRDAARAWRAVWLMVGGGDAVVEFVQQRLDPEVGIDKQLLELVHQLDSDSFVHRARATEQLAKMGPRAAAALRQARAMHLSAEAEWRIDALLEKLGTQRIEDPEVLKHMRAVQVLEMIGSDKATALLSEYAGGEAGAFLTLEAKRALERLTDEAG